MTPLRTEQNIRYYYFDDVNVIPMTLKNEDNCHFEYTKRLEGTIATYKRINKKIENKRNKYTHQSYLRIYLTEQLEDAYYFIILRNKKRNECYSLERSIKKSIFRYKYEQGNHTYESKQIQHCVLFLGIDLPISVGKYDLFLYQKSKIQPNKTDLCSYLQQLSIFDQCYITEVMVKEASNGISFQKNGKKTYKRHQITFFKDQNPPMDKRIILIVKDKDQFKTTIENQLISQTTSNLNWDISKMLREQISKYLKSNKKIDNLYHPLYRNEPIKQISDLILNSLNETSIEQLFHGLIEKYIDRPNIIPFNILLNQRKQKYNTIENQQLGLNNEKLQSFLIENGLKPELSLLINGDYQWFLLHEAIELLQIEGKYDKIKPDIEKFSNEVYRRMEKIRIYEENTYGNIKNGIIIK